MDFGNDILQKKKIFCERVSRFNQTTEFGQMSFSLTKNNTSYTAIYPEHNHSAIFYNNHQPRLI